MKQMIELLDIKTVITYSKDQRKKLDILSRDMDDMKKSPTKYLEMKTKW